MLDKVPIMITYIEKLVFFLELCSNKHHKCEKGESHPTSGDEVEASRAEKPNDGVRRPGSVTRREFAFPRGWKVEEQRRRLRGGGYWVGWTEG